MSNTKATPVKPASPEELKAILAALSPEDRAKLEASLKSGAAKSRRKTEDEIRKEYPHVVEGSMTWNEGAGKQQVKITCAHDGCEEQREVFTSDLFQVRMCSTHRKEQRAEARKARQAEQKALIEKGRKALESEKAGS